MKLCSLGLIMSHYPFLSYCIEISFSNIVLNASYSLTESSSLDGEVLHCSDSLKSFVKFSLKLCSVTFILFLLLDVQSFIL